MQALIVDEVKIVNLDIESKINDFNQNTSHFVMVTVFSSEDPNLLADSYIVNHAADLVVLYAKEQNTLTVAKPFDSDLSSESIKNILKRGREENISATLNNIIAPLINLVTRQGGRSDVLCALIKDGVCDRTCPNDLDCMCGNGICESFENYVTCQSDCANIVKYKCALVKDGMCTENCIFFDLDCEFNPAYSDIPLKSLVFFARLRMFLIVVLVALVVFFVLLVSKKRWER